MPRSLKKGFYLPESLKNKVNALNRANKKSTIKTWARSAMITPDFIGHTFAVHNGKSMIPVYVTPDMLGHKLGEFSKTRTFKGHGVGKKGKK